MLVYSAKRGFKNSSIQILEPISPQKDVRKALSRVVFNSHGGYSYKPSQAYFNKISKMAGRKALPKII